MPSRLISPVDLHALVAAGKSMASGEEHYAVQPIDLWRNPFASGRAEGETLLDAMRAYLDWEVDLMAQLTRDDSIRFKRFPFPADSEPKT